MRRPFKRLKKTNLDILNYQTKRLIEKFHSRNPLETAIEAEKYLSIFPQSITLHNILGSAHQALGNYEKAIKIFKDALKIDPSNANVYYNLGNAHFEQDKFSDASYFYKLALSFDAKFENAHYNLGNCFLKMNKPNEAKLSFENTIKVNKNNLAAHHNLAVALQHLGELRSALESYTHAINIDHTHADSWVNGAEILDRLNDMESLSLWIDNGFRNTYEGHPGLMLAKCKFIYRINNHKSAFLMAKNIDSRQLSAEQKIDLFQLLGRCSDRLADYGEAFKHFTSMNETAKYCSKHNAQRADEYTLKVQEQLHILRQKAPASHNSSREPASNFSPVFLVGFPRSGTTLLDVILRAHSQILVVEEKPCLSSARAHLESKGYFDFVSSDIPKIEIEFAVTKYREVFFNKTFDTNEEKVLIDKLPLNLVQVPLIKKLFPKSKFILALRHPMDAILSCWMQNFRANDAMVNFYQLEKTVQLYCLAMETFSTCRDQYELEVHEIKYEDLLGNFDGSISATLQFLGLSWDQNIYQYREKAVVRDDLTTPSYSQVVQPFYKHAKFRWENYREQLKPYFKEVEFWANHYKYNL